MRVLGIESSCDETAAAIIDAGTRVLADVVASHAEMRLELVSLQVLGAHRATVQTLAGLLAAAGRACDHSSRVSQAIAAMAAADVDAVQPVELAQPVSTALDLVEAMSPRPGVFARPLSPPPAEVSAHPGVLTLVLTHLARAHALSLSPGYTVRVELRAGNDRAVVQLRTERVEQPAQRVSGTHGVTAEVTSVLTPSVTARLRELLGRWRGELEIEHTASRGLSTRVTLPLASGG